MYLTEAQVNSVLTEPFWSLPRTLHTTDYALYRSAVRASVTTIRYNVHQFNVDRRDFIADSVRSDCRLLFAPGGRLNCSCQYDLLLVNVQSVPHSYYIWRANSNQRTFRTEQERSLVNTEFQVNTFVDQALDFNLEFFDTFYADSGVHIDKVLAFVFTFVPES